MSFQNPRSSYFSAVFSSSPSFSEGRDRTVRLPDVQPASLRALLRFAYCGAAWLETREGAAATGERAPDLLALSDRFGLLAGEELAGRCEGAMRRGLERGNALAVLVRMGLLTGGGGSVMREIIS